MSRYVNFLIYQSLRILSDYWRMSREVFFCKFSVIYIHLDDSKDKN